MKEIKKLEIKHNEDITELKNERKNGSNKSKGMILLYMKNATFYVILVTLTYNVSISTSFNGSPYKAVLLFIGGQGNSWGFMNKFILYILSTFEIIALFMSIFFSKKFLVNIVTTGCVIELTSLGAEDPGYGVNGFRGSIVIGGVIQDLRSFPRVPNVPGCRGILLVTLWKPGNTCEVIHSAMFDTHAYHTAAVNLDFYLK